MTGDWRQGFLAPRLRWVQVAKAERSRGLAALQDEHGLELAACDFTTGEVRRIGVPTDGFIDSAWVAADATSAFFLADDGGNELGHVHRVLLDDPSVIEDMTPGLPDYTLRGADVSADGETLVLDLVTDEGYDLVCLPVRGAPATSPRRLVRTVHEAWNCRISADGTVATLDTTDHAPGTRRFAVTAYDTVTGAVVGRLMLPSSGAATAVCCSPHRGDQRVLVATQRAGDRSGVLVWDPVGDTTVELLEETTATVVPLDWSPDGRHVLLCLELLAAQWLERVDVLTGERERLDLPAGSFRSPYLRTSQFGPGGTVLASHEHGMSPLTLIAWQAPSRHRVVLGGDGSADRAGFEHVVFPSSDGTQIQGWLARPTGTGPFPAVVHCHGGPHVCVADEFTPAARAWVEHGFAFLTVNYRGSSGRGRAFEEQIHGDVGRWELEDLAAAHRWLVDGGISAAGQILINGESYGGFLVLYALGRQPELWAAGIGEVVLADWELTHHDSPLAMRRLDEMLFGGPPETHGDLYRERSPLTYVDEVRAPILLWQGSNDTRTPPGQVVAYAERLAARDHPCELHWFEGGHGFGDEGGHLAHLERAIAFARTAVGG
ncbi:prolyl oligopeptidase family serine peptidase [Dactylosporangium sp. NPDC050588]|uniref:S9 family peptidase n=1 Tax=Dactylosporangium sp. NPDC050588 TaxID=3157211 RepID=UPI0033FBB3FC